MQVTDIEITHHHYDSLKARHCANVALSLAGDTVNLFCQIDLPPDCTPVSHKRVFVGEAERQLRRMPEFRSGRRTLEIADHLLA